MESLSTQTEAGVNPPTADFMPMICFIVCLQVLNTLTTWCCCWLSHLNLLVVSLNSEQTFAADDITNCLWVFSIQFKQYLCHIFNISTWLVAKSLTLVTSLFLLPNLLRLIQSNLIIIMISIYSRDAFSSWWNVVQSPKIELFPNAPSWEKNVWPWDQLWWISTSTQCICNVTISTTNLLLILLFVYSEYPFICTSLQRPLQAHRHLSLCWQSRKEQPGFDFPTDLPVRGVVPSTQSFGTVTMLAQTQAEHPPPLFPGPWECNTLLTKSHFPFLSNFHTLAPLLRRLVCPMKRGLGWHAFDSFHLLHFSHQSPEYFNFNSLSFST